MGNLSRNRDNTTVYVIAHNSDSMDSSLSYSFIISLRDRREDLFEKYIFSVLA